MKFVFFMSELHGYLCMYVKCSLTLSYKKKKDFSSETLGVGDLKELVLKGKYSIIEGTKMQL